MGDLTIPQHHLLRLLNETRKGGGFAQACDRREERKAAHDLAEKGLARWTGESFGSSFWAITDEGVAYLDANPRM